MNTIRSERPVRRQTRTTKSMSLAALALPLLATLGACSSGGTSGITSPTGTPTPTTSTTRDSQGTLADSTGVSVNGTRYSTDSTRFTNDGLPTTRDSLSPGMQVTVRSEGTNAVSVEYDASVRGPIDVVNLDGTLSVLGQTVTASPETVYTLLAGPVFVAGDVVEVSGLRAADGSIAATWIGLESADSDHYEVEGVVSALDAVAGTFVIGALTVDYGAATLAGFAAGAPVNGDVVEVADSALLYEPGSMQLVATDVERHSPDNASDQDTDEHGEAGTEDDDDAIEGVDGQDNDGQNGPNDQFDGGGDYEIEALITAIDGNGGFTVGTVPVRVSTSTVFRNGDASGIVLDALVEAEGMLAADGVLDATTIEFSR